MQPSCTALQPSVSSGGRQRSRRTRHHHSSQQLRAKALQAALQRQGCNTHMQGASLAGTAGEEGSELRADGAEDVTASSAQLPDLAALHLPPLQRMQIAPSSNAGSMLHQPRRTGAANAARRRMTAHSLRSCPAVNLGVSGVAVEAPERSSQHAIVPHSPTHGRHHAHVPVQAISAFTGASASAYPGPTAGRQGHGSRHHLPGHSIPGPELHTAHHGAATWLHSLSSGAPRAAVPDPELPLINATQPHSGGQADSAPSLERPSVAALPGVDTDALPGQPLLAHAHRQQHAEVDGPAVAGQTWGEQTRVPAGVAGALEKPLLGWTRTTGPQHARSTMRNRQRGDSCLHRPVVPSLHRSQGWHQKRRGPGSNAHVSAGLRSVAGALSTSHEEQVEHGGGPEGNGRPVMIDNELFELVSSDAADGRGSDHEG